MKELRGILVLIIVFLLLNLLTFINFYPQLDLELGEIAPREIRASSSTFYEDKLATEIEQETAARSVPPVYKYNVYINYQVEDLIKDTFNKVARINSTTNNLEGRKIRLEKELDIKLDEKTYTYLAKIPQSSTHRLELIALEIMKRTMRHEIRDTTEDILRARRSIKSQIRKLSLKDEYIYLLEDILLKCLRPNSIYDKETTEARRLQAKKKVTPIILPIKMGEIIIRKGERVNEGHLSKLEALNNKHNINIGIIIINLSFILIMSIYLWLFKSDIFYDTRLLILLSILIILPLFLVKVINNPYLSGYQVILPLIAGLMLISILLDLHLSLIINIFFCIQLLMLTNYDVRFVILCSISGIVGVLSVYRITKRSDIARAGGIIAVANLFIIIGIGLIEVASLRETLINSIIGISNGIGASILTIGGLFFLEKPFRIATAIDLLELASPNEPLLKRLMNETPGTYAHSVYVANLASAAAEAIHADPLLTRVGGYFHDIGKIKRPYFYIENQLSVENVHKNLSPELSASIIKAHIADGVELAESYRLPPIVIDFVKEHHGTSVIQYFYQKDKKMSDNNHQPNEKNFRYDGPKPQTKESALVMLADTVEASIKALESKTPENMLNTVKKVIAEKLQDGQLDESNLTFKDIDKIINAFMQLLEGMYHLRIEYEEKDIDKEPPQEDKNK